MILHVDAKCSVPLPHTPTTGTGVQPYAKYALTGAADFVGEGMTAFVTDFTAGSNENTDTIINVILFQVVLAGLGEQVPILVMDDCTANRNGFIAMALAQFLVDHGLYKVVVVVFLQRHHSKQIADRKCVKVPPVHHTHARAPYCYTSYKPPSLSYFLDGTRGFGRCASTPWRTWPSAAYSRACTTCPTGAAT